ncbi:hypothetical protein J9303_16260 [Bacillaceae bacterium Marseille-Q3522]|nr:hypothetical protein [Bacillaceae bacterium Marseille-Q3522]
MSEQTLTLQEWHKKQAITNFNATWDLMEKKERTAEDNLKMIHTSHASRFHWGEIGTPVHFARGEWQISRVYSLLKMQESALYHGNNCLKLCKENDIGDFDLAFAYEAIARAYMVNGEKELMNKCRNLAEEAGENISKKEDKQYFFSELKSIIL